MYVFNCENMIKMAQYCHWVIILTNEQWLSFNLKNLYTSNTCRKYPPRRQIFGSSYHWFDLDCVVTEFVILTSSVLFLKIHFLKKSETPMHQFLWKFNKAKLKLSCFPRQGYSHLSIIYQQNGFI